MAHPACIVPPQILEAMARNGDAATRDWALRTLSIDTTMRTARVTTHLQRRRAAHVTSPAAAPHKMRRIYTANNTTDLPGSLVRTEGQPASGDAAADEAYDGLGATFDLYWNVYQRNSIDDAGMDLIGTVHYDKDHDNASWDGSQMVFGDGDGQYFNRFTLSIDVMGHELTHGVTGNTARLEYHDQPGALNESMSDVFGSLVKQYASSPQQTAQQADWLIGAGLFTTRVNGVALRSMKAPGTAYDDPTLGTDPQPAHMSNYDATTTDNGGVHINSGIPNHAFYLAATALGGFAWEKAGLIWYRTLLDSRLSATAAFLDFATLSIDNAAKLFGPPEQQAVRDAWQQVGITATEGPTKIAGKWALHFSWGCTNTYQQAVLTFGNDGSITGESTGRWWQQDGTLLLSFDDGPAKYAGTLVGNVATGTQSTFGGMNGCWYLMKQDTTVASAAAGSRESYDLAGNPVSSMRRPS
jgi:Zn-dependent metalloprotease